MLRPVTRGIEDRSPTHLHDVLLALVVPMLAQLHAQRRALELARVGGRRRFVVAVAAERAPRGVRAARGVRADDHDERERVAARVGGAQQDGEPRGEREQQRLDKRRVELERAWR